jgi:hypothetical protein
MKRLIPNIQLALCLALLVGVFACDSASPPSSAPSSTPSSSSVPSLDAAAVAQEISSGVGTVLKTSTAGTRGPIFVFEEVHTSRIGQLQIATMLLRLHDRHSVKTIGLEGSVWTGRPLQGTWYQGIDKNQARGAKEDLAVRMVADGEISSSELMAILFQDAQVYGVEDAGQYRQNLDVKGSPDGEYLLAIAERSLSPADTKKVLRMAKAKKQKQAVEYMLKADPWVKQQYQAIKNSGIVSSEELVGTLQGIKAKADEVGAHVSPQSRQDMDNEISFMQTASARSATMVENLLQIPGAAGRPASLIVGAAHANKVVNLLTQKGVSFALLRSADWNSKKGSMSIAEYKRKDNGEWARNDPGTLGHVLNTRHKPPPVIERPTGHSYASMSLASILLARSARSGGSFPDDALSQISALPGLRIDTNSIQRDGYDVIYRAWLKQDDGSEREVWARVGTHVRGGGQQSKSLEEKLIEKGDEFRAGGGGGGEGGNGNRRGRHAADEPPGGDGDHDSVVPGDIRRGREIVSKIGIDTLVSYGASHEEVAGVRHISD